MLKVEPASSYPPEEGRYLRGNDYSPVAVAVILLYDQEKIPPDIENLVRVGLESGAALSGTLQTENIGIEKLICNVVANPNLRYLVIFGPESPGQLTWRVTRPQAEPKDEGERQQRERLRDLMARVKRGAEKKRGPERP